MEKIISEKQFSGMSIKKYEGKNHFEKNQIICLIRLAELSKEYRCKNIKEGLELCNQAQDIYNKYDSE